MLSLQESAQGSLLKFSIKESHCFRKKKKKKNHHRQPKAIDSRLKWSLKNKPLIKRLSEQKHFGLKLKRKQHRQSSEPQGEGQFTKKVPLLKKSCLWLPPTSLMKTQRAGFVGEV